jgi:hypothetical protein
MFRFAKVSSLVLPFVVVLGGCAAEPVGTNDDATASASEAATVVAAPARIHGEATALALTADAPVLLNWPAIFTTDSIPVDGFATVRVWPDGSYQFQGNFHDTGFPSYDDGIVFVLRASSGRVYQFSHTGHMAGTLESGSRDNSWTDSGTNPDIAAHWGELAAGFTWDARANASLDIGSLWNDLKTAIGAIGEVVAVVGPLLA